VAISTPCNFLTFARSLLPVRSPLSGKVSAEKILPFQRQTSPTFGGMVSNWACAEKALHKSNTKINRRMVSLFLIYKM
jgi:hypothetical protein